MAKMNVAKSGGPGKDAPSNRGPEQRSVDSAASPTAFFAQDVWGGDAGTIDEDDNVRSLGNSRANRPGEEGGNDASTGAQGVPPGTHPVSKTDNPVGTGAGQGSVMIKKVGASGNAGALTNSTSGGGADSSA